jgi:glucose 1-dehydrogenase
VEFAREGADVVVHYLHDEQGANSTRARVEEQGRRAIVVQGDHGYEDQVERCSPPP